MLACLLKTGQPTKNVQCRFFVEAPLLTPILMRRNETAAGNVIAKWLHPYSTGWASLSDDVL
jgi:hypothetical protein